MNWAKQLPDSVELIAVQPPGRTTRMFESAYTDMDNLTNDLLKVIQKHINKPYVLFGHSLGSRIAFELMAKLKNNGLVLPEYFIASGSRGPNKTIIKKSIYNLPEEEFVVELKTLNGTPEEILQNKELMELYIPLLRADFQIADTYSCSSDVKFDCPVSVFGGEDDDEISFSDLSSWNDFFLHEAEVKMLPGNHFFIDKNQELVISYVNIILKRILNNINQCDDTQELMSNC